MRSLFSTRRRWAFAALFAGLVLASFTGGVLLVAANVNGGDSAVTVFQHPTGRPALVTTYPSAAEAASAAAKASGSPVPQPDVPAGFRLVSLDIAPMPPGLGVVAPSRVYAKYEKGAAWFNLLYVGSRFGFSGDEDAANRLQPPKAGQDLFRVTGKDYIEYTLLTPDRGFVITVRNPSPLTGAEAIRILTSIAN